jgi:hypothetical protein
MIDFNIITKTDLRDTGGRYMVLAELDNVPMYEIGGVKVYPEDLGLSKIDFFSANSFTALPDGEGQPWQQVSQMSIQRMQLDGDDESTWRIIIFVKNQEGFFEELPDGIPLDMPDQIRPVVFAIGS